MNNKFLLANEIKNFILSSDSILINYPKKDIIIKIDNITLEKMSDLRKYIYTKNVGDEVILRIQRNNVEKEVNILTDAIGVIADAINGINATIDEATVGVMDIAEKTGAVVSETTENAEMVDACMESVEELEDIAKKFAL